MKQRFMRRLLRRIGLFLVGLGIFAVGLGPLIRAKSSPGDVRGLTFAPIGIIVGVLAMTAAIFRKDGSVEDARSPKDRRKQRR
jgi:membrane-associated protease RseP (regulator of RpoE activity)